MLLTADEGAVSTKFGSVMMDSIHVMVIHGEEQTVSEKKKTVGGSTLPVLLLDSGTPAIVNQQGSLETVAALLES